MTKMTKNDLAWDQSIWRQIHQIPDLVWTASRPASGRPGLTSRCQTWPGQPPGLPLVDLVLMSGVIRRQTWPEPAYGTGLAGTVPVAIMSES